MSLAGGCSEILGTSSGNLNCGKTLVVSGSLKILVGLHVEFVKTVN